MRFVALSCVVVVSWLGTAVGKAAETNADVDAVRAAVKSYTDAFNRADAKAVAEHWAEDAEYVLPSGQRIEGRAAILKMFQKQFGEKQTPKIEILKADVRLLGKDTALEEGTARVTEPDGEAEETSYLAIHVRQGKDWKLTTVRETTLPPAPAPAVNEQYEHLKELEWLVGVWQGASDSGDALTRFDWAKNQKFIKGQFRVPKADGESIEGTQVIGWDAESQVIRSWMFDSEGGFGEGLWSRGDGNWVVKFVQVLPDGRRASSTNFYTVTDDDSFVWKTIGRKIDGAFAENMGPAKMVRVRESAADSKPELKPNKSEGKKETIKKEFDKKDAATSQGKDNKAKR